MHISIDDLGGSMEALANVHVLMFNVDLKETEKKFLYVRVLVTLRSLA